MKIIVPVFMNQLEQLKHVKSCSHNSKCEMLCHNSKCDCKMLKVAVIIRNVTAKC